MQSIVGAKQFFGADSLFETYCANTVYWALKTNYAFKARHGSANSTKITFFKI